MTRCPKCGRPVRVLVDEGDEGIMVSGKPHLVAFQVPWLPGYVTVYASKVHQCPR